MKVAQLQTQTKPGIYRIIVHCATLSSTLLTTRSQGYTPCSPRKKLLFFHKFVNLQQIHSLLEFFAPHCPSQYMTYFKDCCSMKQKNLKTIYCLLVFFFFGDRFSHFHCQSNSNYFQIHKHSRT